MESNNKYYNEKELEELLLNLSDTLKLYWKYEPYLTEGIADVVKLTREGIITNLIQFSQSDCEFSAFINDLITDKYSKFKLTEEQINKIKTIVDSSELLSTLRTSADSNKIDKIFPKISIHIARNNLSLRENVRNLEELAEKLKNKNLREAEEILTMFHRTRHINYETGESYKLAEEDPERFINVGKRTLEKQGMKDEEYIKACISNATFLYERFPLIIENYDELENGIVYDEENIKPKEK